MNKCVFFIYTLILKVQNTMAKNLHKENIAAASTAQKI